MPYPYKMITLSEREIGRIAGNAAAHAQLMSDDLTAMWREKVPKGQKVINIMQLQLCVRDDLRELRRQIVEIEREHHDELEADLETRLLRDDNVPKLRERLIGIQGLFESAYGGGGSAKAFGPNVVAIPTEVLALRRVGLHAHERLMKPELVLPAPRMVGVEIDPQALAKSFEGPLFRLDEVLVGLEDTLPVSNQSLEKKIWKLDEMKRKAGVYARFLESLYHLAGHDVVAERVRLSEHRSRRGGDTPGNDPGEDGAIDLAVNADPAGDAFPFEATDSAVAADTDPSSAADAA